MIHLFKNVYATTHYIREVLYWYDTVISDLDLDSAEQWHSVYSSTDKILLTFSDSVFCSLVTRFYSTLFPSIDISELVQSVNNQFNNNTGFTQQYYTKSVSDYLTNFNIVVRDTNALPISLAKQDLGLEFLLMYYIHDQSTTDIVCARIDRMLRKKVCGVMQDFTNILLKNLPSVCRMYNVNALDPNIKNLLIEKNHNFKYIFGQNTITELDAVLAFYQFIEDVFIRNRISEWPMPSGMRDYYGNPKALLAALIAGTDPRTRGWPGEEWFYQINKSLWNLILTKQHDRAWLDYYLNHIELNR